MVRVKVFMMQRNEGDILKEWLEYHGFLFGFKNLHVIDDGSTDRSARILKSYTNKGVKVRFVRNRFTNKGNDLLEWCKELYRADQVDLFLPLDADEFVALREDKRVYTASRHKLFQYLERLSKYPRIYRVGYWMYGAEEALSYHNVFREQRKFYKKEGRQKHFFHPYLVSSLDRGFHEPVAQSPQVKTFYCALTLFHYHYRGVKKMVQKAKSAVASLGLNPEDLTTLRKYHYAPQRSLGSRQKISYLVNYYQYGGQWFLRRDQNGLIPCDAVYDTLRKLSLV